MKPALLLIDLQKDFMARPSLVPPAEDLVCRAEYLLKGCRKLSVPVVHVHTIVYADGTNRMPHWKRQEIWECVTGTPGAAPPNGLKPDPKEEVFQKQFFSAFQDKRLETFFQDSGIDKLIIAGLYTHGCLRATIMDAYERGLDIWVAEDATASTDPLHAKITRDYLASRAAEFLSSKEILEKLARIAATSSVLHSRGQPVGFIGGDWRLAEGHTVWEHENPAKTAGKKILVPCASSHDVTSAVNALSGAVERWQEVPWELRAELLENWASKLEKRENDLACLMSEETGKPIVMGEGEVRFTVSLLREAVIPAIREPQNITSLSRGIAERRCPLGVVGIITPWNNPVAIPIGKIAPALGFGNGVVWKAAPQVSRTTRAITETLMEAGLPEGTFSLLFGGKKTARDLILAAGVDAVTFTGSCEAGIKIAELCARHPKPLQAELGGNNAAIIMDDADLEKAAKDLVPSAFSFSGQRCTATRRFIVHQNVLSQFKEIFIEVTKTLRIGDPLDRKTDIGPVISREKQRMLENIVADAIKQGASLILGGGPPEGWDFGCWFEPTLLFSPDPDLAVVTQEIFGPVAVLQPARDGDEAIDLLNRVKQGLVASLYSNDHQFQRTFLNKAKCGMLKLNRPTYEAVPEAPFIGWKTSGLGPPEHGIWDREFYTRPQALYGWS